MGYLGTTRVVTLPRLHAHGQQRLRQVDYRHVIHSLAAKPQAFRYSRLRDDLLPNDRYRRLWRIIDHALPAREACKMDGRGAAHRRGPRLRSHPHR